jgi:hypothetical protein
MSFLRVAFWAGALGFAAVLIFGEWSPPKDRACGSKAEALVMSRTFVKQRLKAPSTASFAKSKDPEVEITSGAPCEFKVRAWVDAQNGFGAMIRSKYTVSLRYTANDDSWRATDIMIFD